MRGLKQHIAMAFPMLEGSSWSSGYKPSMSTGFQSGVDNQGHTTCMFEFKIPELENTTDDYVVTLNLLQRDCSKYTRHVGPNIIKNQTVVKNGIWHALVLFGECVSINSGEAKLFNPLIHDGTTNMTEKNTAVLEWHYAEINHTTTDRLELATGHQHQTAYNYIDFHATLDGCRDLWDLGDTNDISCRVNFLYEVVAPCDMELNGVNFVPTINPNGSCTFYTNPYIDALTTTGFTGSKPFSVKYRLLGPYVSYVNDESNLYETTNFEDLEAADISAFTNMTHDRRIKLKKVLMYRNFTENGLLIYGADLVAYNYNGTLNYRKNACKSSANLPAYYPPAADDDLLFYTDTLKEDPRPPNTAVNISLYVEPRSTNECFIRRWNTWSSHGHIVEFNTTCRK